MRWWSVVLLLIFQGPKHASRVWKRKLMMIIMSCVGFGDNCCRHINNLLFESIRREEMNWMNADLLFTAIIVICDIISRLDVGSLTYFQSCWVSRSVSLSFSPPTLFSTSSSWSTVVNTSSWQTWLLCRGHRVFICGSFLPSSALLILIPVTTSDYLRFSLSFLTGNNHNIATSSRGIRNHRRPYTFFLLSGVSAVEFEPGMILVVMREVTSRSVVTEKSSSDWFFSEVSFK